VDPRIVELVGEVTEHQLRFVECFLSSRLGIFVPVLGQCGYAVQVAHIHPAWMLLVSSEECPVSQVPVHPAPPGFHLRLLAPGVPHQELPSDEPHRYYAIMVEPAWFESVAASACVEVSRFCWEPYPASERLLYLLRDFMREHDVGASLEVLDALALLVLNEVFRCTRGQAAPLGLGNPEMALRAVVDTMEHRPAVGWKLIDFAKLAGMSVSSFQRAFRASLHCSPMAYLNGIRLRRASHLLRTGASLSQAALETGYASVSHFSEAFRKAHGQSPGQYRKSYLASTDQIRHESDRKTEGRRRAS
jgi:AraC-like DNA-binding protein